MDRCAALGGWKMAGKSPLFSDTRMCLSRMCRGVSGNSGDTVG
jgi:hypothetical protein